VVRAVPWRGCGYTLRASAREQRPERCDFTPARASSGQAYEGTLRAMGTTRGGGAIVLLTGLAAAGLAAWLLTGAGLSANVVGTGSATVGIAAGVGAGAVLTKHERDTMGVVRSCQSGKVAPARAGTPPTVGVECTHLATQRAALEEGAMHAVLVTLNLDPARMDEALQFLNSFAIPTIRQGAGFVSGTWLRSPDGTHGHSVLLYDSQAAAEAAVARATQGPPVDAPVRFVSAESFEVIAQA
jgi:hypothetical protein